MKYLLFIAIFTNLLSGNMSKKIEHDVRCASCSFGDIAHPDYICKAVFTKEIKSDGVYNGFIAMSSLWASSHFNQDYKVIYFENPNHMGRILPLDVLVSDLIIPGTNSPSKLFYESSTKKGLQKFLSEYEYDFDETLLIRKRALEIYGPVNKRFVSNYSYQLLGKSSFGGDIVGFSSKGSISKDMRIFCADGRLHFDQNNRIRRIEVHNMEDRYSSYIRNYSPEQMEKVTDYTFIVEYKWIGDSVVTSYVEQETCWVMPENKSLKYYYSSSKAPYKSPIENKISTVQKVFFSDFLLRCSEEYSDDDFVKLRYVENSSYEYWQKELKEKVPFSEIEREMSRTGRSLKVQNENFISSFKERLKEKAVDFEWPSEDIPALLERNVECNKMARAFFNVLYHKDYNSL